MITREHHETRIAAEAAAWSAACIAHGWPDVSTPREFSPHGSLSSPSEIAAAWREASRLALAAAASFETDVASPPAADVALVEEARAAFVVLDDEAAAMRGGPAAPAEIHHFGWTLYEQDADGTLLRALGSDGGEPEDQLLVRDWAWVADALNQERRRGAALRSAAGPAPSGDALAAEARSLAAAATPGPWRAEYLSGSLHYVYAGHAWIAQVVLGDSDDRKRQHAADAAFIARMRTLVPALASRIDALTAEVAGLGAISAAALAVYDAPSCPCCEPSNGANQKIRDEAWTALGVVLAPYREAKERALAAAGGAKGGDRG